MIIKFNSNAWYQIKQEFKIDKLILIGTPNGYYKGFCISNSRKNAVYFNLDQSVAQITIVEKSKIKQRNLSKIVPVEYAINYLKNDVFKLSNPNKEIVEEILHFFEINK